jgi:DNA-binding NtrC family response regulator
MDTNKLLVLVIEDNREIRLSAHFILEDFGFLVDEVESPSHAIDWLMRNKADLILLDMNFGLDTTSGEDGLNFLKWLRQKGLDIPVVAMTAWSNTELVVKAMRMGANDFIEKPWDNNRLNQVLQQTLKLHTLHKDNLALHQRLECTVPVLIWESEVMDKLMQQLSVVAPTDANILLTGENGTGKSQFAHWIHLNSLRAREPIISVNMGAIPESLFESDMFGHKRGAFTDAKEQRIGRFELAGCGTLFMDEIGTIPLAQQTKLLRVLESGEFEMVGSSQTQRTDARIISASNCDFAKLIAEGTFRQDLYYRLNTLEFRVPPLRERPADIPVLARFFVEKHGNRYRKPELKLSNSAFKSLQAYSWPGNIRELSHVMERAVLLAQHDELTSFELNLSPATAPEKLPFMALDAAELQLIRQALAECEGNKQKAASLLGITKSSLYRRIEKYDLAN